MKSLVSHKAELDQYFKLEKNEQASSGHCAICFPIYLGIFLQSIAIWVVLYTMKILKENRIQ